MAPRCIHKQAKTKPHIPNLKFCTPTKYKHKPQTIRGVAKRIKANKLYPFTPNRVAALFMSQLTCELCRVRFERDGKAIRCAIDHFHESPVSKKGPYRARLCMRCNTAEGRTLKAARRTEPDDSKKQATAHVDLLVTERNLNRDTVIAVLARTQPHYRNA